MIQLLICSGQHDHHYLQQTWSVSERREAKRGEIQEHSQWDQGQKECWEKERSLYWGVGTNLQGEINSTHFTSRHYPERESRIQHWTKTWLEKKRKRPWYHPLQWSPAVLFWCCPDNRQLCRVRHPSQCLQVSIWRTGQNKCLVICEACEIPCLKQRFPCQTWSVKKAWSVLENTKESLAKQHTVHTY